MYIYGYSNSILLTVTTMIKLKSQLHTLYFTRNWCSWSRQWHVYVITRKGQSHCMLSNWCAVSLNNWYGSHNQSPGPFYLLNLVTLGTELTPFLAVANCVLNLVWGGQFLLCQNWSRGQILAFTINGHWSIFRVNMFGVTAPDLSLECH